MTTAWEVAIALLVSAVVTGAAILTLGIYASPRLVSDVCLVVSIILMLVALTRAVR